MSLISRALGYRQGALQEHKGLVLVAQVFIVAGVAHESTREQQRVGTRSFGIGERFDVAVEHHERTGCLTSFRQALTLLHQRL